jgi:hypothetical protein
MPRLPGPSPRWCQPQGGAAVPRCLGLLASKSNTKIIPANAGDVAGFVATAMSVLDRVRAAPAARRS